jgi:hypothetical protein
MGFEDRSPSKRLPRGAKFALNEKGAAAERAYREAIVASRSTEGRSSYEAAATAWSSTYGVQPSDGPCLCELAVGAKTKRELSDELATSGTTPDEVQASLERLTKAELVDVIQKTSP